MGNHIKEIRLTLNITQQELAEFVGITRQHLRSIENMEKQPSIKISYLISKKLGVSMDELFYPYDEQAQ